jgi:membrane-associated phospholipid phosphatase
VTGPAPTPLKLKRWWLPAIAGGGAMAVALATAGGPGRRLDRRLYRWLNGFESQAADRFFKGVTELGSIWASFGATAALAREGRRREALDALGAAGAMWILGQIAKRIVVRPRPFQALPDVRLMIQEPRGTSWPSSHPAVLLAFVTVASRNLGAGPALKAGVGLLAGTVGLSRIHLGVHYPADVAGGILLGWGVAELWSAVVSPRVLGPLPEPTVPATVTG